MPRKTTDLLLFCLCGDDLCSCQSENHDYSEEQTKQLSQRKTTAGRWSTCRGLRGKCSRVLSNDCESFARRTFTTPKIRTFTTPKFGHFPPPKKNICQEDNCHPQFFFFFWRTFLGFFDLQLMEDIKDGKEEVLDEVVMEHIK